MKSRLILLGLNELNFSFIKFYIKKGLLPNFKKLFDIQEPIETLSEAKYELLEPWIQWVTVHTGKFFKDHKIFRLGDIVNHPELSQLFEELESHGLKVGAVSPFNAENRLKNPAFFIPDPWTKTNTSGNWLIQSIYSAIHQTVNDNAQEKLNIKSILSLAIGFIKFVPVNQWYKYIKNILSIGKPGIKALILDSLLSDIFIYMNKKFKPDFSNLFLNSGAHIQHHYLFNSEAYDGNLKNPDWYCNNNYDPLIKILSQYDSIIGRILKIKNVRLIIATGLHQQPHEHITYYWRIKRHEKFVKLIGVKNFSEIIPRMSRDFLINFNSKKDASDAELLLNSFYMSKDNSKIFNIDNRGDSLFIELIYPNEIKEDDSIYSKINKFSLNDFKSYLAFVAIKNGEHNGTGYLSSNFELNVKKKIPLTELNSILKKTAINLQ